MKTILLSLGLSFLLSCTSALNIDNPPFSEISSSYMKRDMLIDFNGKKYVGVAALPQYKEYNLSFHWPTEASLINVSNCSFDVQSYNLLDGGYSYTVIYKPIDDLKEIAPCLMEVVALDRETGEHSWATIDFNVNEQLEFISLCGEDTQGFSLGNAVCQSRSGLLARVKFKEPVLIREEDGCPGLLEVGDNVYEYSIALGSCMYVFLGKTSEKFGRLTTIGYNSFMIRSRGGKDKKHKLEDVVKSPQDILRGNR